jgi:threonine dehydrogenase-like Zn-dependent dehydrogenase
LPTALKLVRPRGTIVLKTTVAGAQTLAWAPFVIDEVTLIGSRCGPFEQALAALEQGQVKVEPLIADRFDLSKGLEALERAQTKGILKVLLDVS